MNELLALVEQHEQAALQALAAATGDVGLCTLARSGQSHPAAKFHEGSARALAGVRRALRRDPDADVATVLARTHEKWRADQEAFSGRSRDWDAYHAGGIDALERLEEQLG